MRFTCNSQLVFANCIRAQSLPEPGTETFFFWGPRQSGKTTLLRQRYPAAVWIDLLKADEFRRYATRPGLLREELAKSGGRFVGVDEVQKVPALLDEAHWLHENAGVHFAAALTDTEQVNVTNLGRELGVSRETVRGYFEILGDTLLARMLPPYRKRPKRWLSLADKFYFHDVGVVNFLARRGSIEPGSELFGRAFENWVFHELCCYNSYCDRFAEFSFWRLSIGAEVDFIGSLSFRARPH